MMSDYVINVVLYVDICFKINVDRYRDLNYSSFNLYWTILMTGCGGTKHFIDHKYVTFTIYSFVYMVLILVSNSHILLMNGFCTSYPSLACLTAAGHHSDCLKLVNDWMVTDGPTSDLYILRARLHKLLNQVTTAGNLLHFKYLKPAA